MAKVKTMKKKAASDYVLVYITAGDMAEARTIREMLIKERLVACVNIMPIESMWWWKGKIESGPEVAMLAKTKTALVDEIIREVKNIHKYEAPCVLALPILKGNPAFLKWVDEVVK